MRRLLRRRDRYTSKNPTLVGHVHALAYWSAYAIEKARAEAKKIAVFLDVDDGD